MKTFRLAFASILMVGAMLGFAGAVAAGEHVPFSGSLVGNVTTTPIIDSPPWDLRVEISGSGNATILGNFSAFIPHDVDRRIPPPSFALGTYEFIAANRDEVFATFEGYSWPTDDPNVLVIVEYAEIVGGTGRFENATGSFTAYRVFDRAAGVTIGYFEGTISRPGR